MVVVTVGCSLSAPKFLDEKNTHRVSEIYDAKKIQTRPQQEENYGLIPAA